MTDASRIATLSSVETIPRQTQNRSFGEAVNHALTTVGQAGASMLNGVAGAMPILSTAMAGVQSVRGLSASPMASTAGYSGTASTPSISGTGTLGSSSGAGVEQLLAQSNGQDLSNTQLLMLQQQINQESQQYTTISNVLKVRSDSAKSAINNIR